MQRAPQLDTSGGLPAHHEAGERLLLSFDGVTKFYGPVIGVNNISCRIGPGITGLFGRQRRGQEHADQAGQRAIAAHARARCASARITPGAPRPNIIWATAPTLTSFYEEMTGREFVVRHGPAARLLASRSAPRTELRAGRSGHGRSRRAAAGRLQPRHATAHQAGPGAGARSLAAVARRADDRHRSRAAGAKSTSCCFDWPIRARRSWSRATFWSKSNSSGRLDPDDLARPDRGLGARWPKSAS